jgi:hypothetical protein
VPFFSFFVYAPWLNAGYATRLIKCGKVWSVAYLRYSLIFSWLLGFSCFRCFCGVIGCLWRGLSKWVTTARRRLGSKRVASGAFGDSRGLLADWSCLGDPLGARGCTRSP